MSPLLCRGYSRCQSECHRDGNIWVHRWQCSVAWHVLQPWLQHVPSVSKSDIQFLDFRVGQLRHHLCESDCHVLIQYFCGINVSQNQQLYSVWWSQAIHGDSDVMEPSGPWLFGCYEAKQSSSSDVGSLNLILRLPLSGDLVIKLLINGASSQGPAGVQWALHH